MATNHQNVSNASTHNNINGTAPALSIISHSRNGYPRQPYYCPPDGPTFVPPHTIRGPKLRAYEPLHSPPEVSSVPPILHAASERPVLSTYSTGSLDSLMSAEPVEGQLNTFRTENGSLYQRVKVGYKTKYWPIKEDTLPPLPHPATVAEHSPTPPPARTPPTTESTYPSETSGSSSVYLHQIPPPSAGPSTLPPADCTLVNLAIPPQLSISRSRHSRLYIDPEERAREQSSQINMEKAAEQRSRKKKDQRAKAKARRQEQRGTGTAAVEGTGDASSKVKARKGVRNQNVEPVPTPPASAAPAPCPQIPTLIELLHYDTEKSLEAIYEEKVVGSLKLPFGVSSSSSFSAALALPGNTSSSAPVLPTLLSSSSASALLAFPAAYNTSTALGKRRAPEDESEAGPPAQRLCLTQEDIDYGRSFGADDGDAIFAGATEPDDDHGLFGSDDQDEEYDFLEDAMEKV